MADREQDSSADRNAVERGQGDADQRRISKPTLEELIAEIEPENVHGETDWGPDVEKERWWDRP